MYNSLLEAIWPIFTPSRPHCAATEVDVAGPSGSLLLEWLGESVRECDAVDHKSN